MEIRHTPRLFVESALAAGQAVTLGPEQSHYLRNVMRLAPGEVLRLFNGKDGEWKGAVVEFGGKGGKASCSIRIEECLRQQTTDADLWLCAAPIKKAHFEYMIEKATELGVHTIQPMLTARTQIREVNSERLRGIAIEVAEQSERLSVPIIHAALTLKELTAKWPQDRALIVCAELGDAKPIHAALLSPQLKAAKKCAILSGPEGGFAEEEFAALRKIGNATFVRLGPRILRADTAAISALVCWQALHGDWNVAETSRDKTIDEISP